MPVVRSIGAIAVASLLVQGGGSSSAAAVLDRFDFRPTHAAHVELRRGLDEISGLARTVDGETLGHDDEKAVIAALDPCAGLVTKSFAFGNPTARGDFEGIATVGARIFLVTSGGMLYEGREGTDNARMTFVQRNTGFARRCEIEGLAFEPADSTLLLGCKHPNDPAWRDDVSILRYSLARQAPASPERIAIALAAVNRVTGGKAFHTSAIERDGRTGHYVLVAGPQRLLLEVSSAGVVLGGRKMDRQLHRQPEGITLVGDSVLVIADEGGGGRGSITCYRRRS